jgi:Putative MetA-pathway of phenol degradation
MATRYWVGAALCALALDTHASCGAAFCLVNTDWSAQGVAVDDGLRADLHHEYIDLDQPRSGRDRVSVGEIPRDHDEVETRNRNWVATFDWSPAPLWGLSATVPFVDREHIHVHNHDGEAIAETWHFRELGDIRVQARRELFAGGTEERPHSWGVMFGVKLPTGKHDVRNEDGEEAERTLQPGSGTTDAILGAYWHAAAPLEGWSWFARAQAVLPMNTRDEFKPGRQLLVDGGARYAVSRNVGLMLQANFQAKGRDSGAQAEPEDSGQRQLFVSPGVSWNFAKNAQVYAFVQLPVYQAVNGVQLTADWSALGGVSLRF